MKDTDSTAQPRRLPGVVSSAWFGGYFVCKSGLHSWREMESAARCCNGWHRELRLGGPLPTDDPVGQVQTENHAMVWVRDGVAKPKPPNNRTEP